MEKSVKTFMFMGIIDFSALDSRINLKESVTSAIRGGVTIIIVKENCPDEERFYNTIRDIKEVCREHKVPMVIHGNIKTAYNCEADGVELDFEDGDLLYARRVFGMRALVGAVVHNVLEALAVWAAGADYVVLEDSFEEDNIEINGCLKEICDRMTVPVVAAGRITPENVNRLRKYDINGVAVSSVLFSSENVYSMALLMNEIICNMIGRK